MNITEFIIYYFIGWILFSIGFYIYHTYLWGKDTYKNKKLLAYASIKHGIFSWIGICICCIGALAVGIIYGLYELDQWIKDKLWE